MAAVISLNAVVDEMEMLGEEMHAFLNRQTGELYGGTTDLLRMADGADEEDLLGWEVEIVGRLREILASSDWVELPQRESHEDYRIMERYCLEQCEGQLQEELLNAIAGRGAFGRFKDLVHRRGVHEAWYAFQRQCLAEDAARWLDSLEIEYKP